MGIFLTRVCLDHEGAGQIYDPSELIPPELSETADGILSGAGLDALLSELLSAIRGGVGAAASFLLLTLGFAVLISFSSLSAGFFDSRISSAMTAAVSAVSTFSVFSSLLPLVRSAEEGLSALSGFFSSVIPLMSSLFAAGGGVSTAGVQAANMNMTLGILDLVGGGFLLPLVMLSLALSLVTLRKEDQGSGISASVRSIFLFFLGGVSVVLIAVTGLQTVLAASADSLTIRTARYAISGSLPIVSGTVSGAFSALFASVSHGITVVGVSSVVIMLSLALSPLIYMLMYRLALRLALGFLDITGTKESATPLTAIASSLDLLTALYAVSVLTYIIEVALVMKCGVNIFG